MTTNKLIPSLDVGCGSAPRGDVNCDRFFKYGSREIPFNPKQIKNFVFCDASCLPFRKNSFKTVYASHILEHLDEPLKALREWRRVSKCKVIIAVPNLKLMNFGEPTNGHIYTWSRFSFHHLLERVFSDVTVIVEPRTLEFLSSRGHNYPKIIKWIWARILLYFIPLRIDHLIGIAKI